VIVLTYGRVNKSMTLVNRLFEVFTSTVILDL
jgi:hypothetical protein